jgi:hypothetical protein
MNGESPFIIRRELSKGEFRVTGIEGDDDEDGELVDNNEWYLFKYVALVYIHTYIHSYYTYIHTHTYRIHQHTNIHTIQECRKMRFPSGTLSTFLAI